jgi:predicted outer membrane repeat protein
MDGNANGPQRVTKNSTTHSGGGVFAVGDSKKQMQQSDGLLLAAILHLTVRSLNNNLSD